MPVCAYCGGEHARAADVRACWERSQRSQRRAPAHAPASAPATAAPAPRASATGAGRFEPVLGRSVVVAPGAEPPAAWHRCDRWDGSLDSLEQAWRERVPLVIEGDAEPPVDEVEGAPVWSLDPSFSFEGERLAHAMFANSVDARSGTPRWRWAEEALRLGAAPGGPADVVRPDGRAALCDGGPTGFVDGLGAEVVPRVALLAGSLAALGRNDTDAPLAPDQLAAVTHPGGAARIIAPAGSGKTRVLTERARHLLRRWNIPGSAVTLVAFNKRAADEMVERTADLPELQVRTLNALGLSLVNRSRRVNTLEERDVRDIIGTLVALPRRANTDAAAAWIEALSAVRLGLADPKAVEAEFGGDVDGLPEVLERYRKALADRNTVDFDEQIYGAIEILLTDPVARERARSGCRLLLVDEFQDLTPAHLLLVRLLAGPEGAVFGVGDDDQTIYGYSGASPEWLIEYRRYFPSAGLHPLEVNYRCPPAVVEAATRLLSHNRRRVEKRIVPAPGRPPEGPALEVRLAGDDPLSATVAHVVDLTERGVAPRSVAVLTRVNASLAPVQISLLHHGVPVRAAVDESYLARGGVEAALAWLRLATAGGSRLRGRDVGVAARRPARGLAPRVVEWMRDQRDVRGLERLAGRLGGRDAGKVLDFVADLEAVREAAAGGTTAEVLRLVRDEIGLDDAMHLLEGSRRRLDRSAQTDDLDALVALAALHPDPAGFEAWLREALRDPGRADGVVLATVHSVKGREWPHVVVHDVRDGLVPHRLASDREEERRVFHVAITRCSESVCLVVADPPSPFVLELTERWTPERVRRPPRDRVPARVPPRSPEASKASEALRAWRRERARAIGKPAFVVFSDATLDAIAGAMPASIAALAEVKGVGPAKLEAYGDEILAVLDGVRGG